MINEKQVGRVKEEVKKKKEVRKVEEMEKILATSGKRKRQGKS